MKRYPLFRLTVVTSLMWGVTVFILGWPQLAAAQEPIGATFTYQGRLQRSGVYLNNQNCDFTFSLFDAPAGGSQLGAAQAVNAVPVRDGYFQVRLNEANQFGLAVFSGQRRYLAVAVRCSGETGFTALGRVELKAAPYAQHVLTATTPGSVPWTNITGLPAGFADGLDQDDMNYTAGWGLSQTDQQFSLMTDAVLNAISSTVQLRISGSCSGNQAIQSVNRDGSVVCAATTTTYAAGNGLTLTGSTFSIDDTITQRRVADDCGNSGSGQAIRRINPDGTVLCEGVPPGDISGVVTGSGLTGTGYGPGPVTITVSAGGVTAGMLADSAVTAPKWGDGAIQQSHLANGAVTSEKILDRSILFNDLGMVCGSGQLMKITDGDWFCAPNDNYTLLAGPGTAINSGVVSAQAGEGISTGSGSLAVTFGGSGSSSQPARSDHHHDLYYVKPTSEIPGGGSVTGNYEDGWTVTKLQGRDIVPNPPLPGQGLRYVGGQWGPASYNFPLQIETQIVKATGSDPQGVVQATCPEDKRLVGGGCDCSTGKKIKDSFPMGADTFYCNCEKDDNPQSAYAICMKTRYE